MTDFAELQKEIYRNKVEKCFNTTDVCMEFCYTYGELSEAFEAYRKKRGDIGQELADVAIYLLGLAEILGIDLEAEILRKVAINRNRVYRNVDGVNCRVSE